VIATHVNTAALLGCQSNFELRNFFPSVQSEMKAALLQRHPETGREEKARGESSEEWS
jgi:hypothetical protein